MNPFFLTFFFITNLYFSAYWSVLDPFPLYLLSFRLIAMFMSLFYVYFFSFGAIFPFILLSGCFRVYSIHFMMVYFKWCYTTSIKETCSIHFMFLSGFYAIFVTNFMYIINYIIHYYFCLNIHYLLKGNMKKVGRPVFLSGIIFLSSRHPLTKVDLLTNNIIQFYLVWKCLYLILVFKRYFCWI